MQAKTNKKPKLGLIVGAKKLPLLLAAELAKKGRSFTVLTISGVADEKAWKKYNPKSIKIGELGKAFKILKEEGVKQVIFLGKVHRPSLTEIKPDFKAAKVLFKLALNKAFGDDNLLRAVNKVFAAEGFQVVGIAGLLDELRAQPKLYTKAKPSKEQMLDIKRGFSLAKKIGALDLYQSLVIQEGIVLAIEGADGTDAMIRHAGKIRREGAGGVLVKVSKPGQSKKQDLPVIGLDTIKEVHKAGLVGIAIEAKNTLVVEEEKVVEYANKHKLFLFAEKL